MTTDWSKIFEVFSSGIVGVFVVMFLVQILTQISCRLIDALESRVKSKGGSEELKSGAPQSVKG